MEIWQITLQIYEILCNVIQNVNRQSVSLTFDQLQRMKREIESYAQKILLHEIKEVPASNSYLYTYNISMMSMIVQYFIRSNWITEGITQNAGQQNEAINFSKLVKQVIVFIRSSGANSKYIVFNDPVNQ